MASVDRSLRHQFEEVKEKLVQGGGSLQILGIMGTQLPINERRSKYFDSPCEKSPHAKVYAI